MKITDKVIDQWIEALTSDDVVRKMILADKLIEVLQGLKIERLTLLQQLKNAESQIGHLTHLTSGLRK